MDSLASSHARSAPAQFVPRDITPPASPGLIESDGLSPARLRSPVPGAPWMRVGECPIHRHSYLGLVLMGLPVPAWLLVSYALTWAVEGFAESPDPMSVLGIPLLLLGGFCGGAALLFATAAPAQRRALAGGAMNPTHFLTIDSYRLKGLRTLALLTGLFVVSFLSIGFSVTEAQFEVLYSVLVLAMGLCGLLGMTFCLIGSVRQRRRSRAQQVAQWENS